MDQDVDIGFNDRTWNYTVCTAKKDRRHCFLYGFYDIDRITVLNDISDIMKTMLCMLHSICQNRPMHCMHREERFMNFYIHCNMKNMIIYQ